MDELDDDKLYTYLVIFPIYILLMYGLGWALAWVFEGIFLGEPYETAIGWQLKTLVGSIFALWYGLIRGGIALYSVR